MEKPIASSDPIQNLEVNWQLLGKMSIFNDGFGSSNPPLSLTLNVEPVNGYQSLKYVWDLQIVALIYHKGLHGLNVLYPGYFLCIEFQQTKTSIQKNYQNEIVSARYHAYRNYPLQFAEFFPFFDKVHSI